MIVINFFVFLISVGGVLGTDLNESCQTPSQDPGICIQLKNCSTLFALAENKPVTDENRKLIIDSRCGHLSDRKPLFCCPQVVENEIAERLDILSSCKTPSNEDGICKIFKTCEPLYSIFERKPVSAENIKLIRKSACGQSSDGKPLVCCPPSRSTTTEAATTMKTTTEFVVGSYCTNPNGKEGTCIKFRDCPNLFKIYETKPISQENRAYLRRSQCGVVDKIPHVCCVPEEKIREEPEEATSIEPPPEQEPEWLTKLKKFLPMPPHCGLGSEDKIFGGEETEINEFPWTVLLEFKTPDNKKNFHCGGSLINNRHVLTAAHCIKKIHPDLKVESVRIGEWRISTLRDCVAKNVCASPVIDNRVVDTFVHPYYRKNSNDQLYDIALLRLARKVDYNEFVKPICLPLDQTLWERNYTKHIFSVAGWGKTETVDKSDVKMKTKVPFVPTKDCKSAYRGLRKIDETQICAGGEKGMDSCNGDSGGPLMFYNYQATPPHWYQVGVVSFGAKDCGNEIYPAAYTKVSSYLEWIAEKIRA